LINSTIGDYAIRSFFSCSGGGIGSPNFLEKIYIPTFNKSNILHKSIFNCSMKAHDLSKGDSLSSLISIESEIDELAAKIWGLTSEELKEIQLSLKELKNE